MFHQCHLNAAGVGHAMAGNAEPGEDLSNAILRQPVDFGGRQFQMFAQI